MPRTDTKSHLIVWGFAALLIVMIALALALGRERPEPPAALLPLQDGSARMIPVTLYAYDPRLDLDPSGNVLCSAQGLVPITREIPEGDTQLRYALEELLAGNLTQDEKARGLTSEFPLPGVSLDDVSVDGGTANILVNDRENKTSGGSCRVSIMRAQIETTAKGFGGVEEVRILPDEAFQP
jgi:hypothetical protein